MMDIVINNNKHIAVLLCGVILSVLTLAETPDGVPANSLFRYKNAQGVQVIDHTLPPEFASKGYEIIDKHGKVLKVVAPQKALSEEEKRAYKAYRDQRQLDEMILKNYRELSELESAKTRRLDQVKRELAILESNVSKNNNLLKNALQKAANYQRQGKAVPAAIEKNLNELFTQERDGHQMLSVREQELADESARFDNYIARFKVLKKQ